nr:hypothetical protein [Eubacterium sp.]
MLFGPRKNRELEQLLESVNMNCSNNYKDAAKMDYEKFWRRLEELKQSGEISTKSYTYYEQEGTKLQGKMKNYNHNNNVRSF